MSVWLPLLTSLVALLGNALAEAVEAPGVYHHPLLKHARARLLKERKEALDMKHALQKDTYVKVFRRTHEVRREQAEQKVAKVQEHKQELEMNATLAFIKAKKAEKAEKELKEKKALAEKAKNIEAWKDKHSKNYMKDKMHRYQEYLRKKRHNLPR
eukprot:TRINITY_DN77415_c0_g1_i1.p1 TRINITY_DN77415_c0_g1~~TRINITY_DN77415_c0_g1_i1.p1  ORF type:complete len:156 (+),score=59.11 TRINITY_DN77415_c0_g1_i1:56-523(+)